MPGTFRDHHLNELAALLRGKPRTVRELAQAQSCAVSTIHRRLFVLMRGGHNFVEIRSSRPHTTGPRPITYGINE